MASYQLYLYLATDVTQYAVTSLRHDVTPKYDNSININKTPSVQILWLGFSRWTNLAGCKDMSAHFIAFIQRKHGEYDELHIVFDRYDIPNSFKSATMHLRLGDSYPVA